MLYISAAWAGGILTSASLWNSLGPGPALAAAPLGASALAAGAACLAALRPGIRQERDCPNGPARGWRQAR
ncbi:hypothetical protein [Methylobacterium radiodurans]|nr:hypothetical protein [Methylobacterium radiodurans]